MNISVDLGKIGNPKFLRSLGYLLNHTPKQSEHEKQTKYEIDKTKSAQKRSYSEFAYKRLQQVKPRP